MQLVGTKKQLPFLVAETVKLKHIFFAALLWKTKKQRSRRVAAITNHALIQCAATLCLTLGFYAIYHNKVGDW